MEITAYKMHVGGRLVGARDGATLDSTDPATGATWATIPDAGAEDVDAAVRAARAAFEDPAWRGITASERGRLLLRLADLVEEHADRLGRIESRDNGKLLRETAAQAKALGRWYRFFGGLADKLDGTRPPDRLPLRRELHACASLSASSPRSPRGTRRCCCATWKLAPALAAGNTVVAKPQRVHLGVAARARRAVRGGGLPARRAQRRHRAGCRRPARR